MSVLFEAYSGLETFRFRGREFAVRQTGSMAVAEGVVCDTYAFDDDETRDLGVIMVEPGHCTPLQLVVGGDCTIEGFMDGIGLLTIGREVAKEEPDVYHMQPYSRGGAPNDVSVGIGQTIQWTTPPEFSGLVAYEICYPPYADGRFENL